MFHPGRPRLPGSRPRARARACDTCACAVDERASRAQPAARGGCRAILAETGAARRYRGRLAASRPLRVNELFRPKPSRCRSFPHRVAWSPWPELVLACAAHWEVRARTSRELREQAIDL